MLAEKLCVAVKCIFVSVSWLVGGEVVMQIFCGHMVNELSVVHLIAKVFIASCERNEGMPHLVDFSSKNVPLAVIKRAHHEKFLHLIGDLICSFKRDLSLIHVSLYDWR